MPSQTEIETVSNLARVWGVTVPTESVCCGHTSPGHMLASWIYDRPGISLGCGPRGGGKSFLSGLRIHLDSMRYARHGTRILGGSLAQSQQIYEALQKLNDAVPGTGVFRKLLNQSAEYVTGSKVSILAATSTSVRGPHVPTLCLDEVDEISEDIRESAFGMCMRLDDVPASVSMTSTWHRVGGPMSDLIERGRDGAFPVWTFCAFEVLEHCPDERSGPNLENCPECPLVTWCHNDRDADPAGRPKAKRANGHYAIDSLTQKASAVSRRVFESDYLCLGPKSDGVWFTSFDESNISDSAEFDPNLPVHVSIDSGVWAGSVLFQRRPVWDAKSRKPIGDEITIFADYLSEGRGSGNVATDILALIDQRCGSARYRVSVDSAGKAREASGTTVFAEYERAGLRGHAGLLHWPKYPGCVSDGLQLIEAMVRSADGKIWLKVHPRCKNTIDALKGYRRAKRAGQWMDYPEDPQHPHEEMVDAIRGGLKIEFPEGRKVEREYAGRVKAGRLV